MVGNRPRVLPNGWRSAKILLSAIYGLRREGREAIAPNFKLS